MGEVKEGLHRVEGHVRPGIGLLEGSQVKALEEASYRNWQQQKHMQHQQQHPAVPELEFDPFSEQELLAMNKPVPKSKTIQRMSKIGGGAFGTTYRKRVRDGAVSSDVSRFAVKVISAEKIEDMQIGADDVRREAKTLGLTAFPSASTPRFICPCKKASQAAKSAQGSRRFGNMSK
jgi:hypothetical protein